MKSSRAFTSALPTSVPRLPGPSGQCDTASGQRATPRPAGPAHRGSTSRAALQMLETSAAPSAQTITTFYRSLRVGDCQGQPAGSALAARCDSPTRKKTRTCNHFFTNQTKQNERQSRVLPQMQGSAHHHAVPPGTCAGDSDTAAPQPPSLTPRCRGWSPHVPRRARAGSCRCGQRVATLRCL